MTYPVQPPPSYSPVPRMQVAYADRARTDYRFSFWTALGWTVLSCGFYGLYVTYQLVRRARDHNLRRLELLDAAIAHAWEKAHQQGLAEELRPNFERAAGQLAVLRGMTGDFRDPAIWTVLYLFGSTIVAIVLFILLDGDLIKHDRAEGAVEDELARIYTRLGAPLPVPDPARVKQPHGYVARVVVTLVTCGVYYFWWQHDVMNDLNRHFDHNWYWEDQLAGAATALG